VDIVRSQKLFGIGPIGAVISFIFLTIAFWVDRLFGHPAILENLSLIRVVSAGLGAIGLGLHLWSMWTLRHWWVEDQLCTTGPFKWFRHPMYAAWITFIIPAVALLFNSWIILSSAVLIHPIWHLLVIREEKMMFEKFQNEYRTYAIKTGRFFPRIWNL
jgi:protein-S-isoprenylcysteine O-methyltransferase Ste14